MSAWRHSTALGPTCRPARAHQVEVVRRRLGQRFGDRGAHRLLEGSAAGERLHPGAVVDVDQHDVVVPGERRLDQWSVAPVVHDRFDADVGQEGLHLARAVVLVDVERARRGPGRRRTWPRCTRSRCACTSATGSWPLSQRSSSARSVCRPTPRPRKNAANERVRSATSPKVRRTVPQTTMARSGAAAATTSWTATKDHSPGSDIQKV